MEPIVLGPNQPATFYRGAGRIERFRRSTADAQPGQGQSESQSRPEDWIGSTTARFGQSLAGLTRLPDGTLLADAVAADPLAWLGAEHLARFGVDTALLVKLLDAGQRLPVHVHPDRRFAAEHLARPYGKTEAWLILEAPADASVQLGFARDVSERELSDWVDTQNVAALVANTNRVPVAAGDALLCPAGLPHAIGAGILLLELQEPTDFSVLLEWDGFGLTRSDASVGLELDLALSCVDRRACDASRLAQLRGAPTAVGSLLPAEADHFFVAERVGAGPLSAAFSVLVVTAGSGLLRSAGGRAQPLHAGQTILIAYSAGSCAIEGDVSAIRCRGGY